MGSVTNAEILRIADIVFCVSVISLKKGKFTDVVFFSSVKMQIYVRIADVFEVYVSINRGFVR